MSTGHCSTQAPQVVQDHSTSGSITPYEAASPTSGRLACSMPEPSTRGKPASGTWWPCSPPSATGVAKFGTAPSATVLPPIR